MIKILIVHHAAHNCKIMLKAWKTRIDNDVICMVSLMQLMHTLSCFFLHPFLLVKLNHHERTFELSWILESWEFMATNSLFHAFYNPTDIFSKLG